MGRGVSPDDRLIALIDESADRSTYRIGAMVMPARGRRLLRADLDAVMDWAERSYGIPAATELHGVEMFQGKEAWRALEPRQRIDVYSSALDAIAWRGEAFIFESVDRARFQQRYAAQPKLNEHEAALMYTLERIQEYAVAQRQAVYVFADDCRFAASVTRSLERFKLEGTWGYRRSKLDRILSIEFVDSAKNRQIQAIDLVTYLKHRIASGRDDGKPKVARANERLWGKVSDKVIRDRLWVP